MRNIRGVVVSNKMKKTVVVRVDRLIRHPKYLKFTRMSKRFKAHDEKYASRIGDEVIIEETRPQSRGKRWRVVEVVTRAPEAGEGEEIASQEAAVS